jgi:hypothetical protein
MKRTFGLLTGAKVALGWFCAHTRRQRACALFRSIGLLPWWPVVWSEPDVCSGSARNNPSRQISTTGHAVKRRVPMRRLAPAARRFCFSAHEVGHGLIVR